MALYGALAGDIAGSTVEYIGVKGDEELFPEGSTFTDDTVLTLAVADAIMSKSLMADAIRTYATLFPVVKGGLWRQVRRVAYRGRRRSCL